MAEFASSPGVLDSTVRVLNTTAQASTTAQERIAAAMEKYNGTLDTRLTTAENDIISLKNENGTLDTRLTTAENENGTLDTRLTTAENDIISLKNKKAAVDHTHAIADVDGLQAALDGKAAVDHKHAIADVDGLQAALDGTGMVILEYGVSTWDDFLEAYEANRVVYCRVGTTNHGLRMAFLAYRQIKGSTAGAEFQYYRSRDAHTNVAQGDEVYIYHLSPNNTWTTTVRNAYTQIVAGEGLKSTYANGVLTISLDQ